MEEKTQLPKEVVEQIKQEGQNMLAFATDNKWSYIQGATAYATKLHLVEQENADLKRWKKEQIALYEPLYDYGMASKEIRLGESIVTFILNRCKEYDKLKEQATGWRPLLESVLREDKTFGTISNPTIDKIKKFLYGE